MNGYAGAILPDNIRHAFHKVKGLLRDCDCFFGGNRRYVDERLDFHLDRQKCSACVKPLLRLDFACGYYLGCESVVYGV